MYERMIGSLQSEITFLRDQLKSKESVYLDNFLEIK